MRKHHRHHGTLALIHHGHRKSQLSLWNLFFSTLFR